MLIQGEKIIFSMKSGFTLNGLDEFSLDDKCLQFTNLGNIIVSKVDCLVEEYVKYSYSDYNVGLKTQIDGESITIVSKSLPFEFVRNGVTRKIDLDLLMVLDYEELISIESKINKMIFEFSSNEIMMIIDSKYIYRGSLSDDGEYFYFKTEDEMTFNFLFNDVEYFSEEYNRITLKGTLYLDINGNIARKVSFIGDLSSYKLPLGFELKVESNKQIELIPFRDNICLASITGSIYKNTFNNRQIFIISNSNYLSIYDRNTKQFLSKVLVENISKYKIDVENYIIFDGKNVFRLTLDKKARGILNIDKIKTITNKNIGYTVRKNPFFIDFDSEYINIYTSSRESILNIEKKNISDIKVYEELSLENGDLVNTEIKYKDRRVWLNLKRNLISELTENVFSEYQISLFENADMREVYDNWIKSVSDTVIYNIFGEIYSTSLSLLKIEFDNFTLLDWIDMSNDIYNRIENLKHRFERICLSLGSILEKNEINYFKSLGMEIDFINFKPLKDIIESIRMSLKQDFSDCQRQIEAISYIFMPKYMRKDFVEDITDRESHSIEYFSKKALENFIHLLNELLPSYIERVIVGVFSTYDKLYIDYCKVDEMDLKHELMNRIRSAHVFKQFSEYNFDDSEYLNSNNTTTLRKDLIEDMYSLVKFYTMRVDSEYYYTGIYI